MTTDTMRELVSIVRELVRELVLKNMCLCFYVSMDGYQHVNTFNIEVSVSVVCLSLQC